MESLKDFTNRIIDLNFQHGVDPEQIGSNSWIGYFHKNVEDKYNKNVPYKLVRKIVRENLESRK